ncbi:bucky ball-like [Cyprinodon tularosa]|uniref:bucky ball-like n=1 Tax=Cyprinodon tularosa TaxID=77115 RepID=UPI0018E212F2|nr:bucky ball-like [Cyprinodon tularosa]
MEAATPNLQHSFGLGPRGPNPKLGSEHTAPGPPRSEEQHHKPFFYIQSSQPYMPVQGLQWPVAMPVPMSYNPYYGYPGLGFGLPMMPHYQQNPYVEPPGFVVPHTHLHLMDYRRMLNQQYYHTMAYHARRFRYQHNSASKEMTSSEVQTEPLLSVHRTSTPRSSECSTNNTPGVSTDQLQSPALTVHSEGHSSEIQEKASSSNAGTPSNSSFVIQTEEVRIECCTTPVGLQLLHSHEAAEVSHSFSQDLVQCSSLTQSGILQDEGLDLPADPSEQNPKVCPDILLVGMPHTEKANSQKQPRNQVACVIANEAGETRSDQDLSLNSKSFHFKVVQVPFDPTYLDKLRKMESTVWSAEETFMTSPVSASNKAINDLPAEKPPEMLMLTTEVPTDEVIPVKEMPPLAEVELEEIIPTVGSIESMSNTNICPGTCDVPLPELTKASEVTLSTTILLDNSPPESDGEQHQHETTNDQDHQDTSFESLPAYLPSTSWLSDFDHSYYCRKMPLPSIKQNRQISLHGPEVSKRRRKLDLDYKDQPNVRKPKERYKPKGKVDRQSISDHECCLSRNLNENRFSSRRSKNERLCTRCTTKRRISTSPISVRDGRTSKRKAVPFQQWNNVLPTCEACKSHGKGQLVRKSSNPDLCSPHYGHDTEGESSGNSSCWTGPKWRVAGNSKKLQDIKRPLASRQMVTRSPAAIPAMLRERNCAHKPEPQNQSVGWERLRHCPHGNTIQETDENCAVPVSLEEKWRSLDQLYLTHRGQTAKRSWRDPTPTTRNGRFMKEATLQHFINHKKTQPLSQGTYTTETRC